LLNIANKISLYKSKLQ